jgi:hypothetical protein
VPRPTAGSCSPVEGMGFVKSALAAWLRPARKGTIETPAAARPAANNCRLVVLMTALRQ